MELIATGRVCGTFGLDGYIKIESYSSEYEHFFCLERMYIVFSKYRLSLGKHKDGWFEVEDAKRAFNFVLVKLKDVDVLEEARCFVGADVMVEKDKAAPLHDGEFYALDLCSCFLRYEGVVVGKILDVAGGGGGYLLEVKKNDGLSCYVPFNDEFVGDVNIDQQYVELKNIWILE